MAERGALPAKGAPVRFRMLNICNCRAGIRRGGRAPLSSKPVCLVQPSKALKTSSPLIAMRTSRIFRKPAPI